MDYKGDFIKELETKWQGYWEKNQTFAAFDNSKKPKFYGLIEFPYPSGDGLHTGHLRPFTALDVVCRQKRLAGYNVLFPIGMDAFGLPTENYAIKHKITPQAATKKNIETFIRQLKMGGFGFDWSRFFTTADEDYYRWTQWIFIEMYKAGLAYKAKEYINWCTSCKIGLANEEVVGGVCERCGGEVVKREREQWILKITKYADRLIDGLKNLDFLEQIKTQQINWIGKSEGAEVKFKVESIKSKVNRELSVFTTRPDTLFGVTFMVVSPEHSLIHELESDISNLKEVKKYLEAARKKTDLERTENKDKSGIELKGIKVINPVSGEAIPIFVADYVLMNYGTGAIMAVPAHDQRDWEFAKKHKLAIQPVIGGGDIDKQAYTEIESGQMINSGEYDGLLVKDFQTKIVAWLEKNKLGKAAVNYKLHDWIFSRQRYWGEPIPMVYCDKCAWQPVPVKDLPIKLPEISDYQPTDDGQSPLSKISDWVNTTCPKCGSPARRETDVMPNWAGSNWYFVRYADPKNNNELADPKKLKYWLPVDWYNGGMEHTTLHLLYSRFVYKFLADIGAVPKAKDIGDEPYRKRTAHGMILGRGNIKMSKSKGNVVNPDDYIKEYGADSLRLYIMFMGPFDQTVAWDDKGVVGIYRFLNRVWHLADRISKEKNIDKPTISLMHKTIKKVTEDISVMHFNTAVSQLMILTNQLEKLPKVPQADLEKLILLLSPFAPHISEELWQRLGHKDGLAQAAWPTYDKNLVKDELINLPIQINGKIRDQIELAYDTEPSAEVEAMVLSRDKVKTAIGASSVKKFMHIKNKIISIVLE